MTARKRLKKLFKRNRRHARKPQQYVEQLEERLLLTAEVGGNRIEQILSQYTAEDFTQGFDSALGNLEDTIDSAAAAVSQIPLVGDELVSAVDPFLNLLGDMRENLQSNVELAFARAGADENASLLELYEGAIFQVFGPNGLDMLQDGSDAGTGVEVTDVVRSAGIDVFTDGTEVEDSEWVQWNVHLADQFHIDIPVDAKIDFESLSGSAALANLGFSIETTGDLRVSVDWEAYLGWGVTLGNQLTSVEPGFFLDAAAVDETGAEVDEVRLTIDVTAAPATDVFGREIPNTPSGLSGNVAVGFVNGSIEDGTVNPATGQVENTKFTVDLTVDVHDASFVLDPDAFLIGPNQALFDRVTDRELAEKIDQKRVPDVLTPRVDAEGEIRLHVSTDTGALPGYSEQKLGFVQGSLGLPEIAFDLNVDASVSHQYIRPARTFVTIPDIDRLELNNVTLDVSPLLNGIVTPMANLVGGTLSPLFNLFGTGLNAGVGFLNSPLPVLDVIGPAMGFGQPTLLSLSGVGNKLDPLFNAVSDIVGLPSDIAGFLQSYNGEPINFGSYAYDFVDENFDRTQTTLAGTINSDVFTALHGERLQRGGFNIDILEPGEMLDFLLGNSFDIVSYNLPAVSLGLAGDFGFDFKALNFGIHAGASLDLKPISFVYDSSGLETIVDAARSGVLPDYRDLLDGFYIRNSPGREFNLSLNVGGGGGVDIGVFFANANTNLSGDLYFDLQDPNEDGKLRLNEIFAVTDGLSSPQKVVNLFDAGVDIAGTFNFSGGYRIFLLFKTITQSISLSGLGIPTNINAGLSLSDVLGYSVSEQPAGEPSLGTEFMEAGERVLRINAGLFADDRVHGSTNYSGGIDVSGRDGSILVTANLPGQGMVTQSFPANADRVLIVGTDGNDTIDFSGLTNISVEVHGLGGHDSIRTGGGNDLIFAGAGNDTVFAGAGNDLVHGEAGDDTIFGEAGADVAEGGHGNDTIDGGADNDILRGGRNDDLLISVGGADQVFGEWGDDTVRIDHRSHATIEGGSGFNTLLIDDSSSSVPLTATLAVETFAVNGGSTSTYAEIDVVNVSLGTRSDALTIHSTAAPVHVDGSVAITEPDTLIIDRSHDAADEQGTLTRSAISGIGLHDVSYSGIENLAIDLGAGSDRFTVQSTAEQTATTINGGSGDDIVTIESIGATKLTQIIGGADDDEAIVRIPGNPTEFAQLGVGVERLVIDNSTSGNSVAWEYSDGRVLAGGNPVVDALGAELVVFTAGTGDGDSLLVEDNVDNPQVITIEKDQVQILEGINLLQQNAAQNFSFNTTDFTTYARGIAGARGITNSPDGSHVYVTGGSHLAVYRRHQDASGNNLLHLEFIQVLIDGMNGVDGLSGAQDVVVSHDGRHVYVASSTDRSVAIFERVAATGRLIYKTRLHLPGHAFSGIVMSTNHRLYATAGPIIFPLFRTPADGRLTVGLARSTGAAITDIAVTPDGGDVFVTAANGIHRYDFNLNGHRVVDSDLSVGESLHTNQSIYSPDGGVRLLLQVDGNLVLHDLRAPGTRLLWHAATHNIGVVRVTMQADGNLVFFNAGGIPVSQTYTNGSGAVRATVQDDGKLVLRRADNSIVQERFEHLALADDPAGAVPYRAVAATNHFVYVGTSTGIRRYNRGLGLHTFRFTERGTDVTSLAVHPPTGNVLAGLDTHSTRRLAGDRLSAGQRLNLGESIYSLNQSFRLTLQSDGNLVLRNLRAPGAPIYWHTASHNKGVAYAEMQGDGNFVLYRQDRFPVWHSASAASGARHATVVDDGSFVLHAADNSLVKILRSAESAPPAPPVTVMPAEIQLFDQNLNTTVFNRNDPGGPHGPTTIQDVTMTGDGVSYSIDPSRASLYLNHVPGFSPENITLSEGESLGRVLRKTGEEDARTVAFGNTAYTLSSKLGTLTITDANTGAERGREIVFGILHAGSLAVADNGRHLYVTNPTEDSLLIYHLDPGGNLAGAPRLIRDGVDGLDGANQIEIAGNHLFVSSPVENTLSVFSGANDGVPTLLSRTSTGLNGPTDLTVSANGFHVYVSSQYNNSVVVFRVAGNGLVHEQTVTAAAGGVVGMSSPQTSVLSNDEQFLYVGGGNDTIAVFRRDAATGRLTFVDSIRNGSQGIQGLDGLNALALSGDDKYLFAAGSTADTIAVFSRDTESGKLRFVQRVRNGSAGVIGLNHPTDLNVIGEQLLITTGGEGGPGGETGGLAYLQIDVSAPDPNAYTASFTGVESLTVHSADGTDRVSLRDVFIETTVETNGGDDEVVIHRAPAGLSTTVNLGADNDEVVLRTSGNGASVRLHGEAGDDTLTTFSTGAGATTVLDSGPGSNLFVVDGTTLGANLQLIGHENGNDILRLDTKGMTPPTSPNRVDGQTSSDGIHFEPNGSIVVTGQSFGVLYSSVDVVARIAAPTAAAGGPYAISEGGSLALDASGTIEPAAGGTVSYHWDLDGDGQFGEAVGKNPLVTWSTLFAAGIDDDGTYQIAVRATNTQGSDEAYATLTVTNTSPTLNLIGDVSLTQYVSFSLNLTAADPGNDAIADYTVDWGDGSSVTVAGVTVAGDTPARLLHTYTASGSFTITVVATDEDGGPYTSTKSVNVVAGPPPTRTLSGNATGSEGTPFALTLASAGPGIVGSWLVDWNDGTTSTLTGAEGVLNHTYADDGNYRITAIVTDGNGATSLATNALSVDVRNVAPTLSFTGGTSAVEGAQYSIQNLSATDPGADTLSQWIVEWGDGNSSLWDPASTFATHVYADDGHFTVRVGARDEDGIYVSASEVAVAVSNVAPVLTIAGDSTVDEGSVYTLNLSTIDPGDDSIREWVIDWGDGTSTNGVPGEVISGNPTSVGHVYADGDNSYTVTAAATDEDGTFAAAASSIVNVKDVAPAPEIAGRALIPEGSSIEISLISNDPGPDLINSWTIDWGDGTAAEVLPGNASSAAHTYADDGEYHIVATLNNNDGSFVADPHRLTVYNVAPETTVSGEVQSSATQPFRLTLNHVIDPGDDTVLEYRIDWGDGSTFGDDTFETFTSNGVVEHTFEDGSDVHAIVVTLVDEDGTFPSAATLLVVNEGSPAPLRMSALGDPASSYIVEWGDGSSTTYSNDDATANDDGLLLIDGEHVYGDNGVYNATISVARPGRSPIQVREFAVVVNNVDPVVVDVTTTTANVGDSQAGDTITLHARLTDASTLDSHTALIDWNDGTTSVVEIPANGGVADFAVDHVYQTAGIYQVSLTVTDDDGGTGESRDTVAFVTGVRVTDDGELQIIGTDRNDIISTSKRRSTLTVFARLDRRNSIIRFRAADIRSIRVNLGDGNDRLFIDREWAIPTSVDAGDGNDSVMTGPGNDHVDGGEGNDHIWTGGGDDLIQAGGGDDRVWAGAGNDIVNGGAGNDLIFGGWGRDILIGGLGRDWIHGGPGENLLIGGTTDHDTDNRALRMIRKEWTSNRPFQTRVNNLRNGGGENESHTFSSSSVHADGEQDRVFGGRDQDWLFLDLLDRTFASQLDLVEL